MRNDLYRCAALGTNWDNRVRVLFSERDRTGPPVLGLEMDAATYRSIPLGVPASPDTFARIAEEHGHRSIIESRATFDDLYQFEYPWNLD